MNVIWYNEKKEQLCQFMQLEVQGEKSSGGNSGNPAKYTKLRLKPRNKSEQFEPQGGKAMKKKIDHMAVAFMQFFRDNYGVKFVDCETDKDLLDDSENDGPQ